MATREIARIYDGTINTIALANSPELSFRSGRAVISPELIDLAEQRPHSFIRRNVLYVPKKFPDNFPKSICHALNLFRTHIGNSLDERARMSESFDRELALHPLQFEIKEMLIFERFSVEPVAGDLH